MTSMPSSFDSGAARDGCCHARPRRHGSCARRRRTCPGTGMTLRSACAERSTFANASRCAFSCPRARVTAPLRRPPSWATIAKSVASNRQLARTVLGVTVPARGSWPCPGTGNDHTFGVQLNRVLGGPRAIRTHDSHVGSARDRASRSRRSRTRPQRLRRRCMGYNLVRRAQLHFGTAARTRTVDRMGSRSTEETTRPWRQDRL